MQGNRPWRCYDVTPDGQRVLLVKPRSSDDHEIVIIENWLEELKRLVPVPD